MKGVKRSRSAKGRGTEPVEGRQTPGAVRPEQTKGLAAGNLQRDAVHRHGLPEASGQPFDDDHLLPCVVSRLAAVRITASAGMPGLRRGPGVGMVTFTAETSFTRSSRVWG